MAITRRHQTGIETGYAYEMDGWGGWAIGTNWISTARPRTGAYGIFCRTDWYWYQWKNIAATRQVRVGLCFNVDDWNNGADGDFMAIETSGGTELIALRSIKATGDLNLIIAGSSQDTTSGLGIVVDNWYHIVIDVKVDSSSGWAYVYKDGNSTPIMSFAGNTGNSDIGRIRIGDPITQGTATIGTFFDDIYIDDTTGEGAAQVGPILRFGWTYPNGAGNYTQWTPSAGNNYECVDERPPSGADYVIEDAVDQLDSYAMTTIALGAGQDPQAVIPIVLAQRYGAGQQIAVGTRYSATDVIGSDQDVQFGGWRFNWERQTAKPGGGAWDQAAIDGFEAVIKSRGSFP